MEMINDSKRREVAAKLRGNPEDTHIPHRIGRHYGMGCHEAADRFWNMCYRIREAGNYDIAFSTTSVLADLIEPTDGFDLDTVQRVCFECMEGCDEPEWTLYTTIYAAIARYKRGESGPTYDRDALLELADELDTCAVDRLNHLGEADRISGREYAERIREALGVEDGY